MAGPAAVTSNVRLTEAPGRQRIAQRQPRQHHVAGQAEGDRVDRELDRLGHAFEGGSVGPLRYVLFEEAGRSAQEEDDEDPGDGEGDTGRGALLARR